jgi:hypothetical protein
MANDCVDHVQAIAQVSNLSQPSAEVELIPDECVDLP